MKKDDLTKLSNLKIKSKFSKLNNPIDFNDIEKCELTLSLLNEDIITYDFDNRNDMLKYIQDFYIQPEDKDMLSTYLPVVLVAFYETNSFEENPEYLITRDWLNVCCYFENQGVVKKFNIFEFDTFEEASLYVRDLSETSSKGLN